MMIEVAAVGQLAPLAPLTSLVARRKSDRTPAESQRAQQAEDAVIVTF